ncbi:Ubiquitin ligase protein cop1, putative isoform 8 [Theobroma cacao]|uniref:Ubiquitin ligase protein cop1, putative isoform 8 n=1 Tax=Theobroma cacao TaxID=3641 RepID=A0A061G6A2_THECC|nr:Ubiquitin ligase protein cop1, putative isoform 8 [Theobroma cacao]
MDGGLSDEVAPIDAAEGTHLQGKEVEYLMKPDNCNMLESREMVIPDEVNTIESSFHVLGNMLEGKKVNRSIGPVNVSEHGCSSPRTIDDANDMVEELTVRNYNGSNLPMVGTSNNRERMQMRQNHWQHFYQLVGGSGSGGSCGNRDNSQAMPSMSQDVGYASFPEFLGQKPLSDGRNEATEQLMSGDIIEVSGSQLSHGGIKTKILSKSGFSEFFVKTTLKGKGVICRGPSHDASRVEPRDQNNTKSTEGTMVAPTAPLKAAGSPVVASNTSLILVNKAVMTSSSYGIMGPRVGECDRDGMNLREWLKAQCHKAKKSECLYIFKQIVDLVDYSHSQGVILHDLCPSFFKLLQPKQVKYIGSGVQKGLLDTVLDKDFPPSENFLIRRRPMEQGMISSVGLCAKKQRFNENKNSTRWPLFHSRAGPKIETVNNTQFSHNESSEHCFNTELSNSGSPYASNSAQQQSVSVNEQLEEKWYASPEELNEGVCTISSNIYSLGVLLFEVQEPIMLNLHFCHEIFMMASMSYFLFYKACWLKSGFCLRLLHPEPSLRPTTRDILQSEVINGFQEVIAEELSSSIIQDDTESELLLHFLSLLKEQQQKHASKLMEDISCLEADIEEVERRRCSRKPLTYSSCNVRECRHLGKEPPISEVHSGLYQLSSASEMRLMRNINHLETAYFSMRSRVQFRETDSMTRPDKDLLENRENWHLAQNNEEIPNPTDSLGAFFDGLCKYARYSKFEVCGILRSGEFNNSANVICSLSFDRDEDYFAAAGVSKKIKIFEFNALFNDSVDIHYPVIEMSNKSKLSCVCWNNYIKNYLASTDYDGLVKLWDASTGQAVSHFIEHEKRAWSVDFSRVYPTKLASGSDDCSVKLWSISEKSCLGTIRNIANVCCVQFSAHSTHLLAFGSADYKTYCYDLRNTRAPWCVLGGHDKAVSYVKFLDSETVVTASTDNTLKLWDLNKTSSAGLSLNACSLTFRGHTNEKVGFCLWQIVFCSYYISTLTRLLSSFVFGLTFHLLLQNFVGLSAADGYIACGSETNEVCAYYRSLPMPITSHKFGSIDPISGKETDDDNGLFVSSVCWRGKSDMVVAANSSGCIKVLQMV